MEYNKYKKLVEKYYQNDCRELNFQNRVIIPFLESFLPKEFEVIDSSTLYQNWKHYKDNNENGICREKFADNYTPDLLIMTGWKLFAEKKDNPSIIIEVKRPTAKDRKHAMNEVKEYLNKADNVILTDTITWEFYKKQNNKNVSIIRLENDEKLVCSRNLKDEGDIAWADENVWKKLKNEIIALVK